MRKEGKTNLKQAKMLKLPYFDSLIFDWLNKKEIKELKRKIKVEKVRWILFNYNQSKHQILNY